MTRSSCRRDNGVVVLDLSSETATKRLGATVQLLVPLNYTNDRPTLPSHVTIYPDSPLRE